MPGVEIRIAQALERIADQGAPRVDEEYLARLIIGVLLREFHAQRFTEYDVFLSTKGRELVEDCLRSQLHNRQ